MTYSDVISNFLLNSKKTLTNDVFHFPGRHKYSVIFGVGNRKYRTCIVKDPEGCPEWNEESVM